MVIVTRQSTMLKEGRGQSPRALASRRRSGVALRPGPSSLQGCSDVQQINRNQESEVHQKCNAESDVSNYNEHGGIRDASGRGNIEVDNAEKQQQKYIKKCSKVVCKLCDVFDEKNTFQSTVTGKRYDVALNAP